MAESSIPHHLVLGMAGHIDHGKTALVKALTGIDTDRLKEEKERGMTTDLGFAFLGNDIAIIDVPGHEKFVKTMVAGVNGVDMALLVIAADDGVMPRRASILRSSGYSRYAMVLLHSTKLILLSQIGWKWSVRTSAHSSQVPSSTVPHHQSERPDRDRD